MMFMMQASPGDNAINQKLLQMLHGAGCCTGHVLRFLEKNPVKHLAAGGKK
jgi:hypothetical protein